MNNLIAQKKHHQGAGSISLRVPDASIICIRRMALEDDSVRQVIIKKPSEGFSKEDMISDMEIMTDDPLQTERRLRLDGVIFINGKNDTLVSAGVLSEFEPLR